MSQHWIAKWTAMGILGLAVISLAACNYPGLQPTQDQFATSAAQTVAAELTRAVAVTPSPSASPTTPEPTQPGDDSGTPGPGPTAAPTTDGCTDKARFVKDVTIPDNTRLDPGEAFQKIWRLENVGTCTWTTEYSLVFDSGNIMQGPPSSPLPQLVPPGTTIDLSVDLVAPLTNGAHKGNWMLRNDRGQKFGLGSDASAPFWVQIVVGPTPTPRPTTVYNFTSHVCEATWTNGVDTLPCPGSAGDSAGYVLVDNTPKLETGAVDDEPALITHPPMVNNGIISGIYPALDVREGDRFKAVIGCLFKSGSACDVKMQVLFSANGGPTQILGQWSEVHDGSIRKLDIDLADRGLAGKSVVFTLVVMANGAPDDDQAFWLLPRIEGPPR